MGAAWSLMGGYHELAADWSGDEQSNKQQQSVARAIFTGNNQKQSAESATSASLQHINRLAGDVARESALRLAYEAVSRRAAVPPQTNKQQQTQTTNSAKQHEPNATQPTDRRYDESAYQHPNHHLTTTRLNTSTHKQAVCAREAAPSSSLATRGRQTSAAAGGGGPSIDLRLSSASGLHYKRQLQSVNKHQNNSQQHHQSPATAPWRVGQRESANNKVEQQQQAPPATTTKQVQTKSCIKSPVPSVTLPAQAPPTSSLTIKHLLSSVDLTATPDEQTQGVGKHAEYYPDSLQSTTTAQPSDRKLQKQISLSRATQVSTSKPTRVAHPTSVEDRKPQTYANTKGGGDLIQTKTAAALIKARSQEAPVMRNYRQLSGPLPPQAGPPLWQLPPLPALRYRQQYPLSPYYYQQHPQLQDNSSLSNNSSLASSTHSVNCSPGRDWGYLLRSNSVPSPDELQLLQYPRPPPRLWIPVSEIQQRAHKPNTLRAEPPKEDLPEFTVMSYNILSDRMVNPDRFPKSPEIALNWEYRRQAILEQLLESNADIIALQEVESEQYESFFKPELARLGNYAGLFEPKSRAKTMGDFHRGRVDGCAIFYKYNRFSLVQKHLLEFNQIAMANAYGSQAMLNRVMTKDNIGLAAILEFKDPSMAASNNEILGHDSDKQGLKIEGVLVDDYKNDDNLVQPGKHGDMSKNNTARRSAATKKKKGALRVEPELARKLQSQEQEKLPPSSGLSVNVSAGKKDDIIRDHSTRKQILVCNTHIHWDPDHCDVKLIQTIMLMNELKCIARYFVEQQQKRRFKLHHAKQQRQQQQQIGRHCNINNVTKSSTTAPNASGHGDKPCQSGGNPTPPSMKLPSQLLSREEREEEMNEFIANYNKQMDVSDIDYDKITQQLPLVLLGDFNSLPKSGVTSFLTNGKINSTHQDFKEFKYTNCSNALALYELLMPEPGKSESSDGQFGGDNPNSLSVSNSQRRQSSPAWCFYSSASRTKSPTSSSSSTASTSSSSKSSGSPTSSSASTTSAYSSTSSSSNNHRPLSKHQSLNLEPSNRGEGTFFSYEHPFELESAYARDSMPYTNYTTKFKGIIDYVYYSRNSLQMTGRLGPLDRNWLNSARVKGLPQPHLPSDHLPLVVSLKFRSANYQQNRSRQGARDSTKAFGGNRAQRRRDQQQPNHQPRKQHATNCRPQSCNRNNNTGKNNITKTPQQFNFQMKRNSSPSNNLYWCNPNKANRPETYSNPTTPTGSLLGRYGASIKPTTLERS